MNADDIYQALQRRHQMPEWVLIRELRLGTGFGSIDWAKWQASGRKSRGRYSIQQRVDAWALNCYAGNGFRRIAYEIKVSRSDFIKEKRDPEKRQPAMEVSDYFYFAAPRGLIAPMELPQGCGLLVVYDSGRSEILERAPKLNPTRLDWCFVASLVRGITEMSKKDLARDRFLDPIEPAVVPVDPNRPDGWLDVGLR